MVNKLMSVLIAALFAATGIAAAEPAKPAEPVKPAAAEPAKPATVGFPARESCSNPLSALSQEGGRTFPGAACGGRGR